MSYNPHSRYRLPGPSVGRNMGAQAGDLYDHQRQAPFPTTPVSEPDTRRLRFVERQRRDSLHRDPATTGHRFDRHQERFSERYPSLPAPFRHVPPSRHPDDLEDEYAESYAPFNEHPAYPSVLGEPGLRKSTTLGRIPRFDGSASATTRHTPHAGQRWHWSETTTRARDERLRLDAGEARPRQLPEPPGLRTPAPLPRNQWPSEYQESRPRQELSDAESLHATHRAREARLEQELAALKLQLASQQAAQDVIAKPSAQARAASSQTAATSSSSLPKMPSIPPLRLAPESSNEGGNQQGEQLGDEAIAEGDPALAELIVRSEFFTVAHPDKSKRWPKLSIHPDRLPLGHPLAATCQVFAICE